MQADLKKGMVWAKSSPVKENASFTSFYFQTHPFFMISDQHEQK